MQLRHSHARRLLCCCLHTTRRSAVRCGRRWRRPASRPAASQPSASTPLTAQWWRLMEVSVLATVRDRACACCSAAVRTCARVRALPAWQGADTRCPPPWQTRCRCSWKLLCMLTCCIAACADGAPLRPALLWMDMRSAAQAAQVAATGDIALQVRRASQLRSCAAATRQRSSSSGHACAVLVLGSRAACATPCCIACMLAHHARNARMPAGQQRRRGARVSRVDGAQGAVAQPAGATRVRRGCYNLRIPGERMAAGACARPGSACSSSQGKTEGVWCCAVDALACC